MSNKKFKVGEMVKCNKVRSFPKTTTIGSEYEVLKVSTLEHIPIIFIKSDSDIISWYDGRDFE